MKHGALLIPALIILFTLSAAAQGGTPKILTAPLAGKVVLRDVSDKYNAQVISLEAPEPDGEGEQAAFRELKARVEQQFPHRRTGVNKNAKTTAVPMPVIVRAFVPDSLTGVPPDNYMAVNNGIDGVNVMNSNISTVNTLTGEIITRKSLASFSSSVGLNNPIGQNIHYRYDPKVIYDSEADRFICVMLNGVNQNNWIVFGFSQTKDPTGAWVFYKVYGNYANDTTWFDYPTIAITHDEFFLTGNKLIYNGSFQEGFRKSVIYQVRKSDGYAGAANLGYRIWDSVNYGGKPVRNIFPVKGGGSVKGPEQYFLSLRNMDATNDSIFLMKIADTIGAPGNSVMVTPLKSNLIYGFPPNGRQPNTNIKLQTNDARILGAYREGSEIQFVSTTVQPSSGADAIYHGIISNYTTAPAVAASYITIDTMDFAYPNISFAGTQAGLNTSIISFDYSGTAHYPGVAAVMWDGTAHSPLLEVKTGDNIIRVLNDTLQRWGDYTGSQPQWNLAGHIWIVGMYGKLNRSYNNWMARLRSPFVPGVGITPVAASNTPATIYPNPALQYIRLRFSLKEEAQLQFRLYSINGALIDEVLNAYCHEGENELQFNTAALAPGQYLLKGVGKNGSNLVTKTFVKQ
jgi:hypothetical protein